jgi:hypothetical protein
VADDHRLLPHLRQGGDTGLRRKRRVAPDLELDLATSPGPGTAGGDARALRGLPAISKAGMGSAIPGTQPLAALMAKQPRD